MAIQRVVLTSKDGHTDSDAVRAARNWECPKCGADIGTLDGHRAPRVGQRCPRCGLWVVEVVRG